MFNLLIASYKLSHLKMRKLPVLMSAQDPWGERQDDKNKRRDDNDGPPDLEELFSKLLNRKRSNNGGNGSKPSMPSLPPVSFKIVGGIAGVAILLWLATGFYTVKERENGVETVLGRYLDTTTSGLNWNWPSPLGHVEKVDVTSISTMRVGEFQTRKGTESTLNQRDGQMLTRDENIVEIGAAVQYRINNAKDYLFQSEHPVDILKDIVVSAIREVVGANSVDDILRDKRNIWPQQAKEIIEKTLQQYHLGFEIVAFELQDARAPAEVQDAFEDAVRAREDEERLRLQAEAYERERLPKARGQAAEMLEQSEAYKVNVLADAKANVSRFDNLLKAYQLNKSVMRERLYLDTMGQVFKDVNKVIVNAPDSKPIINLGASATASTAHVSTHEAAKPESKSTEQSHSDKHSATGSTSTSPLEIEYRERSRGRTRPVRDGAISIDR